MITADQLLCHAIGDYVLQSDWMATEKTKRTLDGWMASLAHVTMYSIPFIFLITDLWQAFVIFATHLLIDHFRLARYVVWAKNCLGPNPPWADCKATGYPPNVPPWMSVWLLIIADNIMHVLINGLALKYL